MTGYPVRGILRTGLTTEHNMRIVISEDVTAIWHKDHSVTVTRPTVFGGMATHTILCDGETSHAHEIIQYVHNREHGHDVPLIQEALPFLNADDREFLLTGITPEKWKETFG